ncbi:hypothetical protein D8674_017778 [Pyrus ussuriensis x Pyrus communis]|uniref:Uncharacterized protein n=1 Tax=Pyrus ussuriensis x Pyrus communis TaxID=2448454 RepID=A0A5N5HEQ6_9ROSA|nr:hypothetical protein D8674_017778 [Pyrus ussuriensis x Pyrus communis]
MGSNIHGPTIVMKGHGNGGDDGGENGEGGSGHIVAWLMASENVVIMVSASSPEGSSGKSAVAPDTHRKTPKSLYPTTIGLSMAQ